MSSDSVLRPLRIVGAKKEGKRALDYVHIIEDLPWKFYERIYDLRLGECDPVTVAEGKGYRAISLVYGASRALKSTKSLK